MRLTKFTDLALRVVLRLAQSHSAQLITAREVSVAVGAPYSHVAKAVSRLQHLEIVDARRGRNGGLALTSFGRNTSVGWIVRELEGVGDVVGCTDDPPCPLLRGCRLRDALRTAQEEFFASLDRVTVRELAEGSPLGLARRPATT
ncbi:RrF2 family transcriptional regulator [Saccharopolyspora phatthalungensis]|uniref:Rrf2 family nitric oxide-sensitive transcriptional repressor n=1 Tax=Saccharopolyspora phatthalungensis TaxID=664693 RepID=A0A840QGE7_9PSEU|nr:Rrf2 family transcriptional regulator [Saccharopolyspora phatthalungensis]MBB5159030.1 Rrf2 family nitric oxide-sensitive transcriptional repressor [Saccharopolyspora phatthalungensis]